ncbi:GNAT family N-acetyltransferase [Frankia sp. AgB32]|uniref:GNAT family N-acetyltransferase n=1 Tax=Frankia sp. AgB32 TaxID=631119 RepID=UPI00200E75EB|nr:GNAT family N-acetyltransferase [Frankia sp. AgB32]MCK9897070.1 GNAT family N-acetyltransferase [Frankia sp. AgB32]
MTGDRQIGDRRIGDRAAFPPSDPLVAPRAGLSVADAALARDLEAAAHRAWPPLRLHDHHGWTLRASAGASRRGNSVWAHGEVPDVPAALAAVAAFYAAEGLPPTFQLTPVSQPAGLVPALDAAGYDDSGPTDVCAAPLGGVTGAAGGGAADPPPIGAATETAPGDGWLRVAEQVLATFGAQRAGTLAVLDAVRLPAVYVTVAVDGVPAAVGRGVLDGRWLGIYSMATLPAARGQGAARRVLAALGQWAAARGATHAYLQVEEVSTVARRLYAELGFRPVYRYSYRRAPAAPVPGPGRRAARPAAEDTP